MAGGVLAATVVVEACVGVTIETLRSAVTAVAVPTKLVSKKPQVMACLLLLTPSDLKMVWEAVLFAERVGEVILDDRWSLAVVGTLKLQ